MFSVKLTALSKAIDAICLNITELLIVLKSEDLLSGLLVCRFWKKNKTQVQPKDMCLTRSLVQLGATADFAVRAAEKSQTNCYVHHIEQIFTEAFWSDVVLIRVALCSTTGGPRH